MLRTFAELSTPLVADACVRLGVPLRTAPPGIGAVVPGHRIAGRALPTRHYGSVDVFLEAFTDARPGDVLVIDNGGRQDEACVGDLLCLEAQAAGLAGAVIWGAPPGHSGTGRDRTARLQLRPHRAGPGPARRTGAGRPGQRALRRPPGHRGRPGLRRRRRGALRPRGPCRRGARDGTHHLGDGARTGRPDPRRADPASAGRLRRLPRAPRRRPVVHVPSAPPAHRRRRGGVAGTGTTRSRGGRAGHGRGADTARAGRSEAP